MRLLTVLALTLIVPPVLVAQSPQITDSAGVRVVTNAAPGPNAPTLRLSAKPRASIGQVEGASEYQLFRASGTMMRDGTILVVNAGTQEARFYDKAGKYVRSLGKKGAGPGEFATIGLTGVLPGDSLLFSDLQQKRYSIFTAAGQFVRSIPGPNDLGPFYTTGGMLSNRRVLVRVGAIPTPVNPPAVQRTTEKLVFLGLDGATVQPFGEFTGAEVMRAGMTSGPLIFGHSFHFFARGERIAVANDDAYSIRIYDASGKMILIVREKRDAAKVRPGEWEEALPPAFRAGGTAANGPFKATFEAQPHLPIKPLFGGSCNAPTCIRFDQAGNLWVDEYRASGFVEEDRWHVFDPRGVFIGKFDVPAKSTILDAGADWILLDQKDDLDVEHVVLYGVERPR